MDLSRDMRYQYGTLNRGVIRRGFRTTNNTVEQILWENMNSFDTNVFTSTNEEGVQRARSEKYAFILPDVIGEYVAHHKPCDLMTVGKFLFSKGYSIALPKGSPRLPTFNRMLTSLKHEGFLAKLYRRWWIERSECYNAKVSKITGDDSAVDVRSNAARGVNSSFSIDQLLLQFVIVSLVFR